jgi:hypothetical protein
VSGSRDSGRGVYLREPSQAEGSVTVSVMAAPRLHQDADVASERLAIEHKLLLRPSAGWVDCPEVLLVHHDGRGFEMRLDCDALAPGLHYAEVGREQFPFCAEFCSTMDGCLFRLARCVPSASEYLCNLILALLCDFAPVMHCDVHVCRCCFFVVLLSVRSNAMIISLSLGFIGVPNLSVLSGALSG